MECSVIKCKCSCHNLYPQEINIKEMLIGQFKQPGQSEMSAPAKQADKSKIFLFDDDDADADADADADGGIVANIRAINSRQNSEQDSLWERRRKIHSGEIKSQTYEDVKHNFQSVEDLKQQIPDFDTDADFLKLASKAATVKKIDVMPCNLKPPNTSIQLVAEVSTDNTIEPIVLNPLHKYKVRERDAIIRDIYLRAHKNIKSFYTEINQNSDEFKNYVNDEANRLLTSWMNMA